MRKEVLGVQADPRSPERGQYGFLQDLVRRVAYETLARRDRKTRHLAAAKQLQQSFGAAEQEIVEVVAAHYLAAYEAQVDAADAAEIKAKACELLARAAERAGSLGALGEARRIYEQAAELADEPVERALLLEQASVKAQGAAEWEPAERAAIAALELLTQAGERHAAARVAGLLGHIESISGRPEQGLRRMEEAFEAVSTDVPDADVAVLASQLARALAFAGEFERSVAPNELALEVSQARRLPEPLARALRTKALQTRAAGRPEEELALVRHALRYALENDLGHHAAASYGELSDACCSGDRYGEALEALGEAVVVARRSGERSTELFALSETTYALTMTGRWDEAVAIFDDLPDEQLRTNPNLASVLSGVLEVFLHRDRLERAREPLATFAYLDSGGHQDRAVYIGARAAVLHAEGALAEALEAGTEAAGFSDVPQAVKQGLVWAVESALALGEGDRAEALLTTVESRPPGLRSPFLEAQAQRFRARMSNDEAGFKSAAGGFREYGIPFWLAVTQLEHAEWLLQQSRGREATALFEEAHDTFVRLQATPWIDRADSLAPRLSGAEPVSA